MSEELYLYFIQSGDVVPLKKNLQDKGKMIAGRNTGCDLYLLQYFSEGKIMHLSGQHFMLYQKNSGLFIEDLHSTNGTEVNNKKLSPNRPLELRVGNIIRLAKEDNFLIRLIDENTMDGTTTVIDESESQPSQPIQEVDSRSMPQRSSEKKKESGLYFNERLKAFIVDGQTIHHLPLRLHDLLKYFCDNAEISCSYYDLEKHVWHGGVVRRDGIRAAVYALRQKLDHISPGAGERYIKTLHGYGYKLTRK